ncbi:MAG: SNF2 helicase-associated domain-containing protein, partial [Actinobacteria bacterium]|nr:SNF2 helicase-associated domain-containing protein [Actinomycetota bacterium]
MRARSRETASEPRTRARRMPGEREDGEERSGEPRTRVRARTREVTGARDPESRSESRREAPRSSPAPEPERPLDGTPQLQLSWHDGRIVAWSAAADAVAEDAASIRERLTAAGTDPSAWSDHDPVKLPGGREAPAIAAPVQQTLGWLVSLAPTATEETLGASVTWLGLVASLGARLVGAGRVVPQLDRTGGASGGKGNRGTYRVRWYPALVDHDELVALARSMPTAVAAFGRHADGRAVTMELLGAFVDAVCADAASRVPVPAAPPDPRSAVDVAESILARLDGTEFEAPTQHAGELIRGLQRWAATVIGSPRLRLIAQLDPPDDSGAWHLKVLVPGGQRKLERVDAAMSNANPDRREHIKGELERLEALVPRLQPRNGRRRGEVLLGQQEAWELMTETGPMLVAAGFEVRVPPLKRKKARPGLRITASEGHETVVGAQQLSSVQWSAVFDDVELTAEDIQRLAAESRPLVKSHGRWVEVDHADLEAAAVALAEREKQDQLTGADMLRYALGLEESPFGTISVAGEGWAADLLRSASEIPTHPPTSPEGFEGELRGYQADALAWLRFLDRAGLG